MVNVTDTESGIAEVILSYSADNGTTWNNITMTPETDDVYMGQISGFSEGTHVGYKIIAYDNAGNVETNNNLGQYYIYTVIPEFPTLTSFPIIALIVTSAITFLKVRHSLKHRKNWRQATGETKNV
ncbi:hypothetical protein KEJ15_05865 [Candidatus Bathyarchaeota archaeon]|nr:hypothetical protein [Candidatus Bathyarchaeota archaeon]